MRCSRCKKENKALIRMSIDAETELYCPICFIQLLKPVKGEVVSAMVLDLWPNPTVFDE